MTTMIWSETYGILLLTWTLVHLLLLIERLKICQCGVFSSKFVRLPTAILISTLLGRILLEIHLLTVHRILRLGEKAVHGQVGVQTRMVALDVVSRGGSAPRGERGLRGGAASRGGRGGSTSQRPTTGSTANARNARTISELRRLEFYRKGESSCVLLEHDN